MRYLRPRFELWPATLTVTTGTLAAGTVADLKATGGTTVQITEVTGAPGFDIEIAWAGVGHFEGIAIKGRYEGSSSHEVRLELYNYTETVWDTVEEFVDDDRNLMCWWTAHVRSTDYISSGAVKARFYHYSSGNGAHTMYLDFATLISGHL